MTARFLILAALLGSAAAVHAQEDSSRDVYSRGVVGMQVTFQMWDEDRPWAKNTPSYRDASGVLVDPGHILTTAQMVDHATLIQLVTFGRSRQVELQPVFIDPDINLALLTVADPVVMQELAPVPLAEHTPTTGVLRTVRWRGQQLEAASSRIIRFEVLRSWGSRIEHAFLQMRTDMDRGGWAEPVFDDGHLVGLTVSQSGQVNQAIPVEIIRRFLARAAEEEYDGFVALGALWQVNRDPSVTRYLGQVGEPRGILIRQVPWGTSGCGVLKPRDILLELDGHVIDAEGFYLHSRLGRLKFPHFLAEGYRPGDTIPIRLLREGREMEERMTLRSYPATLDRIPLRRAGPPAYVIAGGLVIRELDVPYLRTWGKEWSKRAPLSLLTRYFLRQEGQTPVHPRTVVITGLLPAPYNIGYENINDDVIERINGQSIGSIRDVVEALQDPQGSFHTIDLSPESTRRQIVLAAASLDSATAEILQSYRIPSAVQLSDPIPPPMGDSCPGDY